MKDLVGENPDKNSGEDAGNPSGNDPEKPSGKDAENSSASGNDNGNTHKDEVEQPRENGNCSCNGREGEDSKVHYEDWSRDEIEEFLKDNRVALMSDLEPTSFFPYLRSKNVIDITIQERIENTYFTTFEKMGHLLDEIGKRGGFLAFMDVMQAENQSLYFTLTGRAPNPPQELMWKWRKPRTSSNVVVSKMLSLVTAMNNQSNENTHRIKAYEAELQKVEEQNENERQKVERQLRSMSRNVRELRQDSSHWKEEFLKEKETRLKNSELCAELRKQRDEYWEKVNILQQNLDEAELGLKKANGQIGRHASSKHSPEAVRKMKEEIVRLQEQVHKYRVEKALLGSSGPPSEDLQKARFALVEERDQLAEECTELRDKVDEAEAFTKKVQAQCDLYKQQAQQMMTERDEAMSQKDELQKKLSEVGKRHEELKEACNYYQARHKALEQEVEELHYDKKVYHQFCIEPTYMDTASYEPEDQGGANSLYATVRDEDIENVLQEGVYSCYPGLAEKRFTIDPASDSEPEEEDPSPPVPPSLPPERRTHFSNVPVAARKPQSQLPVGLLRIRNNFKPITEYHLLPATMFGNMVEILDLYRKRQKRTLLRHRAYSLNENELPAEVLQNVTLIGGNLTGVFMELNVSDADAAPSRSLPEGNLNSGDKICQVKEAMEGGSSYSLESKTLEYTQQVIKNLRGNLHITTAVNCPAYHNLKMALRHFQDRTFTGDFFCVMVRNNSCWSVPQHMAVRQGTILLITNTTYSEDDWFATIVNAPDGTTLDHGAVPCGKRKLNRKDGIKERHSGPTKTGALQEIYCYVMPYEAQCKRPVILCGEPEHVTSVTATLQADTEFDEATLEDLGLAEWVVEQEPPASPGSARSSAGSGIQETDRDLPEEFLAKLSKTCHLLLPPAAMSILGQLKAVGVHPIIIDLQLEQPEQPSAKEAHSVEEEAITGQFRAHELAIVSCSGASTNDVAALVNEVKAKVNELQAHLIWVTKSGPVACV